MSLDYVAAYTYNAELLCPDCTVDRMLNKHFQSQGLNILNVSSTVEFIKANIREETILDWLAGLDLINRQDEHTFDSGDFPKIVFESMLDNLHSTFHKAACDNCGEELGE